VTQRFGAGCMILPDPSTPQQETAWCPEERVFMQLQSGRVAVIAVYDDADEMLRTVLGLLNVSR
jgi:hypothetical protein